MIKRKLLVLIFTLLALCPLVLAFGTASSAINTVPYPDMENIKWEKSTQVIMGKKGAIYFTSFAPDEIGQLQCFPIDTNEDADRVLGFIDYMQNISIMQTTSNEYYDMLLYTETINIVLCDDWDTEHFILDYSLKVNIDLGGHTWKTGGLMNYSDMSAMFSFTDRYFSGYSVSNGVITTDSGYYYNLFPVYDGNLSLVNVTFRNCDTSCSYSLVDVGEYAHLYMKNVTFENCDTGSYGCVSVGGIARIDNCMFADCIGKYGALILSEDDASAQVTNCHFERCHGKYGTAFYVDGDDCVANFTDCQFIDCVSDGDGGVFYVDGDDAYIYFVGGCALYCSAETDGGFGFINGNDCFIYGDVDSRASGYDSRMAIVGCYAGGDGGAIYTSKDGGCGNGAFIAGFIFSSCKADDWGGAVHIGGSDNYLARCDFIGNYAGEYGGGLYIQTDTAHISDCTFEKNNSADDGPEIYVNDDCVLKNVNIYSNYVYDYALYLDVKESRVSKTNVTFDLNTGFSGRGTEKDPYLITSAYDLVRLSYSMSDSQSYAGKYFYQTNDIGPLTVSVGSIMNTWIYPFAGTYDGGGHTITLYERFDGGATGLFAYAKNATIKNVHVKGNAAANYYVGGVCGKAENTRIENCRSEVSVFSAVSGGIVGYAESSVITGCANSGYIYTWATTLSKYGAGGIVGFSGNSNLIENCDNNGILNGMNYVGGIIGQSVATVSDTTVDNCRNNGSVWARGAFAGGIVGGSGQITVINCATTKYSSAAAQSGYAGGIIGFISFTKNYFTTSREALIGNCTNTGSTGVSWGAYTGGILGYHGGGPVTIENCFNSAFVEGCVVNRVNSTGAILGRTDTSVSPEITSIHCFYRMGSVGSTIAKGLISEDCQKSLRREMNKYVESNHPGTWISWSEGLAKYDGFAAVNPFKVGIEELIGKGTIDEPYIVESGAVLEHIAETLADGTSYKGKYFYLARNIVYSPKSAIADASHPFDGFFEGNDHVIEMNISDGKNASLFGVLKGATVQNVILKGKVTSTQTDGVCNCASLAGVAYDSLIRGCTTQVTVENLSEESGSTTGGFVGKSQNTTFYDCTVNADITANGGTAGGIAAAASGDSEFDLCMNQASVYTPGVAGGIVGTLSGKAKIMNCVSSFAYSMIEGGNETGGIVGLVRVDSDIEIANCASHATVYTDVSYSGGIIGYAQDDGGKLTVKNCFASGDVNGWDWDTAIYAMITSTDSAGEYIDCYFSAYDPWAAESSVGIEYYEDECADDGACAMPFSILQGNAADPENEGYMSWHLGNSTISDGLLTVAFFPQTYSIAKEEEVVEEKTRVFAEGDYIIYTEVDPSMCLDISGGVISAAKGANLQIYDSLSSDGKVFTLVKDMETQSYKIVAKHSGLVLDVAGGSTKNGANVSQWEDHGGDNQRWTFENAEDGCVYIRSALGTYLDVAGGKSDNGTNVQTYSFIEGNEAQMFRLERVSADTVLVPIYPEDGEYIISTALDPFVCLDVSGGENARNNGDNIQLWEEKSSKAGTFTLIRDRDTNTYKIVAKQSGLVLDVVGGSTGSGANVWQWEDLGTSNQRWIIESAGDDYVYIRSASGNFLDVTDGKTDNGTNVRVLAFNGGDEQKFMLSLKRAYTNTTQIHPVEGEYEILSALDYSKCFDISGGQSAKGGGANLQLWTESTSDAKKFILVYDENAGAYQIVAKHSRLALDVEGGSYKSGANVIQWQNNDTSNQRWTFINAGDGNVYIRSLNGNYIDVADGKTADSTNIRVCAYTGDTNQIFRLKLSAPNTAGVEVHPEEGEYVIHTALNDAKCLDISGGANARNQGAVLQLFDASSSGAKTFRIVWDRSKNAYQIIPKHSELPLDVKDASTANKTEIRQWESNGNSAQYWIFESAGDDRVYIRSALGPYLDVDNASTANGTKVQLYEFNGTKAQIFRLEKTEDYSVGTQIRIADGEYEILSFVDLSMCLDIAGGVKASANGANAQLWREANSGAKRYMICYDEKTKAYKIVAKQSGLVLGVEKNRETGTYNVIQWQDYGNNDQRWVFEYAGNGNVFIRSLIDEYMDIEGVEIADGTNVRGFSFTGEEDQMFRLHLVPPETVGAQTRPANGKYVIYTMLDQNYCLDISGGANALNDGDNLQLWTASNSGAKVFELVWNEKRNAYKIYAVQSGKVLDVYNRSSATNTNVIQWTRYEENDQNQYWIFENAKDGNVYIRSMLGTYLNVYQTAYYNPFGGVQYYFPPQNSTNVVASDFTGGASQTFKLVPYNGK